MRAVALQRLMGHTDISITLNTYTSIFNKYKLEEIEKVNDYFINNNILNNRSTFQISDGKNQENDLEITKKAHSFLNALFYIYSLTCNLLVTI